MQRRNSRDSLSGVVPFSDAVYNLKVADDTFISSAPIEKEEMSDSELMRIFTQRRGGGLYILGVIFWTVLMVLTNTWLFFWLNQWMNSPDNTSFYYYEIYSLLLLAGLATIGAHCWL